MGIPKNPATYLTPWLAARYPRSMPQPQSFDRSHLWTGISGLGRALQSPGQNPISAFFGSMNARRQQEQDQAEIERRAKEEEEIRKLKLEQARLSLERSELENEKLKAEEILAEWQPKVDAAQQRQLLGKRQELVSDAAQTLGWAPDVVDRWMSLAETDTGFEERLLDHVALAQSEMSELPATRTLDPGQRRTDEQPYRPATFGPATESPYLSGALARGREARRRRGLEEEGIRVEREDRAQQRSDAAFSRTVDESRLANQALDRQLKEEQLRQLSEVGGPPEFGTNKRKFFDEWREEAGDLREIINSVQTPENAAQAVKEGKPGVMTRDRARARLKEVVGLVTQLEAQGVRAMGLEAGISPEALADDEQQAGAAWEHWTMEDRIRLQATDPMDQEVRQLADQLARTTPGGITRMKNWIYAFREEGKSWGKIRMMLLDLERQIEEQAKAAASAQGERRRLQEQIGAGRGY